MAKNRMKHHSSFFTDAISGILFLLSIANMSMLVGVYDVVGNIDGVDDRIEQVIDEGKRSINTRLSAVELKCSGNLGVGEYKVKDQNPELVINNTINTEISSN